MYFLTIINLTSSPITYLSSTVTVPANGSVVISDLTQQASIATDGYVRSDLNQNNTQLSDGLNTYGSVDAINFLDLLIKNINPLAVSEESIYSRAGQMFNVATNVLTPGVIAETPIFLLSNPSGSGKALRIHLVSLDAPFFAGDATIYRVYAIPSGDITSNGTTLTPSGGRQNSQNSAVVNMYKLPTVSANGLFLGAKVVGFGSNVEVDYNFSQFVEPGYNVLVTAQLSQSNGTCGLFMRYIEEV